MNGPAAPAEQPGTIPGRMWYSAAAGGQSLAALPTGPGDNLVLIGLGSPTTATQRIALNSAQLRELAADLVERAEVLDNTAGRNRKTPAWHIREGERLVSQVRNDTTATDASVLALLACAHFQGAQALRRHTTVHIHHESEGDTT